MSFLRKVENKVESETLKECECVTLKYSYCDRCRKVYVHDRGEVLENSDSTIHYHLCPECFDNFLSFMGKR